MSSQDKLMIRVINTYEETRDEYVDAERYLEKHFPQNGKVLTELLTPLLVPKMSFELKPPVRNLQEMCRKAFFWKAFDKVQVHKLIRYPLARTVEPGSIATWHLEKISLWIRELDGLLDHPCCKKTFDGLEGRVPDVLKGLFDHIKKCLYATEREVSDAVGLHRYEVSLASYLIDIVERAVTYKIMGHDEYNFRPFINLWTTGNFPFAFSTEREKRTVTLYVICKGEPSKKEG